MEEISEDEEESPSPAVKEPVVYATLPTQFPLTQFSQTQQAWEQLHRNQPIASAEALLALNQPSFAGHSTPQQYQALAHPPPPPPPPPPQPKPATISHRERQTSTPETFQSSF